MASGGGGGGGCELPVNYPPSAQPIERLVDGNQFPRLKLESEEEEEGIELSLGLSSNGKFGVDPKTTRNLARSSSSIPNFLSARVGPGTAADAGYAPLVRACSLLAEAEDERRKRKELQSLRRMEAKRKRSEKHMNGGRLGFPVSKGEMRNGMLSGRGAGCSVGGPSPVPPLSSQGSGGCSQKTRSSGTSKLSTEAKSPVSVQSWPVSSDQKVMVPLARSRSCGGMMTESAEEKPLIKFASGNGTSEIIRNLVSSMPCVSTKGYGPDGKRIHGFLYLYRKDEEVRIVCVCHGSIFSPAEFVKHAGGGEVEHPLRHIVINPPPLLS